MPFRFDMPHGPQCGASVLSVGRACVFGHGVLCASGHLRYDSTVIESPVIVPGIVRAKGKPVATLGITDLKAGLGVNINGKDCIVLEAQHVKPGKGNTYVRTKYRDIRTGRVNEENFQQSAKFESVNMRTREMQYLYNDGNAYWFMDTETFEQIPVDAELIGDNDKFLKENDICLLQYANDVLYAVQPPTFIEVEITETDPGFKGDTVQGGTKPATIETGAVIQVPMYLNQGERIKVDTRDGKFVQRV